jgi:chromosome segregation ATPase
VSDLEEQTRTLEAKVEELEKAEKSYQKKEKEWNDIRDGLTNTVKNLKERETELKQELESKKTQDQEELKKRNDRLNKSYFEESEKIKSLFNLSRPRSPRPDVHPRLLLRRQRTLHRR